MSGIKDGFEAHVERLNFADEAARGAARVYIGKIEERLAELKLAISRGKGAWDLIDEVEAIDRLAESMSCAVGENLIMGY